MGTVILLSAEDDVADTIAPRLDLLGADTSKVVALQGVEWKDRNGARHEKGIAIADVETLREEIAAHPDVQLVVIDPVSAYLADTDSHKNAEIRGLLAPLADRALPRPVRRRMVVEAAPRRCSSAQDEVENVSNFAADERAALADPATH
jgi:putative DNA primase/helicase